MMQKHFMFPINRFSIAFTIILIHWWTSKENTILLIEHDRRCWQPILRRLVICLIAIRRRYCTGLWKWQWQAEILHSWTRDDLICLASIIDTYSYPSCLQGMPTWPTIPEYILALPYVWHGTNVAGRIKTRVHEFMISCLGIVSYFVTYMQLYTVEVV